MLIEKGQFGISDCSELIVDKDLMQTMLLKVHWMWMEVLLCICRMMKLG